MEEPTEATADRLLRDLLGRNRNSTSNAVITVNAGGFGLWVAVTCCAVMLAVNLFLVILVMDHSRQISDLKDYLSVIYQVAPHLKPPKKEE